MSKKTPHFFVLGIPEINDRCPNAVYFVRNSFGVSMYVTDSNNKLFPVAGGENSGSGAVTFNNVTADIKAGAINVGDTVKAGSTLQDVVEQLLLNTYYPTFIEPYFSLSHDVNDLQEIGDIIDVNLIGDFDRGSIIGKNNGGTWDANAIQNPRAGEATSYIINGVEQPGDTLQITNYEVMEGDNSFDGKVEYTTGPQPLDSKDNDYDSRYSAGTSDPNSTSFEGVYPIFLGNSSGGEDKRALISHSANNIECEQDFGETNQTRHKITIPNAMIGSKNVVLQQFNPLSGNFDDLAANEFTSSQVAREVQGNQVNYTLYTKSSAMGGPAKYRIKFN